MTSLSDYLQNIIKVVNQHAALLDNISDELDARPEKTEIGELFAMLSRSFPYERSLK